MHHQSTPSDWIARFAPLIPPGSQVLDVACGSGRHARYLQSRGLLVTGVDRDHAAIEALQRDVPGTWVTADIENAPWPETAEARRAARSMLCRLDDPAQVEAGLTALWRQPRSRLAA